MWLFSESLLSQPLPECGGFSLLDIEITPARHPLDADGDDREAGELHPLILGIARPEQLLRLVVLSVDGQDLGRAAQHDPAEPGPVLVIAIGDKSSGRIFDNISEALQCPWVALWLLIDRDVERALADSKANRHEMRRSPRIGGRQMTDPAVGQKTDLVLGQHARILHDFSRPEKPAAMADSGRLG